MTDKTLHLICHPSWMRDELASNTIYALDHSYGLDIPLYTKKDIWWLPQAQAVQLLNSIRHHQITPAPNFTAPSAGLLGTLDKLFTQRSTGLMQAEEAVSVLVGWPTQFWKLATAKSDKFEAKVRSNEELLHDVESAELPPNSWLEFSNPLIGSKAISKEFRIYVMEEDEEFRVTTSSLYLTHSDGVTVTVYDGAEASASEHQAAETFAKKVLEGQTIQRLPPAFVMDVALLFDGSWAVLEFNPVWCSAWYEADIDNVVETIARGFRVTAAEQKAWGYLPDPLLVNKYRSIWYPPSSS